VFAGHTLPVSAVGFSRDGRKLVTGSADRTARIWDLDTRQLQISLVRHNSYVLAASFSPDGSLILTASSDSTARLWNAITGRPVALLSGHEKKGAVRCARFDADGKRIVTASADGTAQIFDPRTAAVLLVLRHEKPVTDGLFSPDGVLIATSCDDGKARIWDAATGRVVCELDHGNRVQSVDFSSDGALLLTAGMDGAAKIWQVSDGKLSELAVQRQSFIHSARFSPDNRRLLLVGKESVEIWDRDASGRVAVVPGRGAAAYSPDGRTAVVGAADNGAHLWPVFASTEALARYARQIVPCGLTREQRDVAYLDPAPPRWYVEMAKWPYNTPEWRHWLSEREAGEPHRTTLTVRTPDQ
jgi:WD40 repeat protein